MSDTLQAYSDSQLVFSSDKRWLYPLFELERYLAACRDRPANLTVRDKIVGRAAALFLVRLRVTSVHAGILSRPGQEVLVRHRIPHTCDELVERVACQTETILQNEWDVEKAYALLRSRARL